MGEAVCLVIGTVAGAFACFLWCRARWKPREVAQADLQTEVERLRQHASNWTAFAKSAVPLIPVLSRQMRVVADQTEQAALDLSNRFRAISQRATEQAAEAAMLFNNDDQDFETLLRQSEGMLAGFVQDVIGSSQIAVSVAEVMDEVETRVLALNAAIEAAQADQRGRGFTVVADEVTTLANRSAQAASDINRLVADVQHSTTSAMDKIQQLASIDLTKTLSVKDKLDLMTNAMMERNQILKTNVLQSRDRAQELAKDVNNIVVSLQFQDMTRQRLEHVVEPLEQMRSHLQALADGNRRNGGCDFSVILKKLEESYTMAHERHIMSAALNGSGGAPTSVASGAKDNVTLFQEAGTSDE